MFVWRSWMAKDTDDDEDEDLEEEVVDEEETSERSDWKWSLTNIGAVMSLVGLLIAVVVFAFMFISGYLFHVLIIPAILLIMIGYLLIVKDHLDNRKKKRRKSKDVPREEE